ncbi:MAG: YcaO-like family protein [Deltaproteobacteria bacterium]|nr:YcaO-like family protein [Deltaproteobacteria bacterium]
MLSRLGTGQGVGWFSCIPERDPTFTDLAAALEEHPHDQFMRQYALDRIGKLEPDELLDLVDKAGKRKPLLRVLAYEASLVSEKFAPLRDRLTANNLEALTHSSPLIYIRWSRAARHESHEDWLRLFSENMTWHKPLPPPDGAGLSIPYDPEAIDQWWAGRAALEQRSHGSGGHEKEGRARAKEAVRQVTKKLERLGILRGWEARTEATISPYAVERPWNLDVTLKQGRNHWRLRGELVSYGRGMHIHQARISCLMEIAERYSAFCRAREETLSGYVGAPTLVKGTYTDLKRGHGAVDPNEFLLEVPYEDQELYWISGEMAGPEGYSRVLVPAQMVFLFANFDEMSLTSGLPSTGLGAGSTMEEARLSGLLEVIERDAEKVVPYCESRRFLLSSDDPKVHDIIGGMKRKGIQIQFLDLTQEFGIPCYKAFIQGPGGVILKGTAAHLDGKRAVASAMTEIPYPYPYWFGSTAPPEGLRTVNDEELPCFSSGDVSKDLRILEEVLLRNGFHPIYVDLTREELEIPVVKVLVPGLELTSVLDRFSPLSLRKFAHYFRDVAHAEQE